MYVSLRNLLRLCYCSGLVAAVSVANAQVTSAGPTAVRSGASFVVNYASNGTPIASAARSITAGAASGEALIMDMLTISGPAGNLPVTVARTATAADVALGLARVASRVAVPLTVGMVALDMLSSVGVRRGTNGAEIDPGQDPGLRDVIKVGTKTATTKAGACAAYAASVYIGEEEWFQNGFPVRANYKPVGYVGYQGQTEVCIVDGFNHLNQLTQPGFRVENFSTTTEPVPCIEASSGAAMLRIDGKCPTGRYEAATEAQAQAKLLPVAQAQTVEALKAAIAAGGAVPSTSPVVAGPATQVGQATTSTSTSPAGSTTVATTPTYQYNYAGDTITYNTVNTVTTNTTSPNGQTETTTETKPQTDVPGLCDLFPGISACKKLDVPDTSGDRLPKEDWSPSITPHVFTSSATCPAPISVSFPRVSFVISWTPLCDLCHDFLAPIVAVLSVFSAARVFFSGFRV